MFMLVNGICSSKCDKTASCNKVQDLVIVRASRYIALSVAVNVGNRIISSWYTCTDHIRYFAIYSYIIVNIIYYILVKTFRIVLCPVTVKSISNQLLDIFKNKSMWQCYF